MATSANHKYTDCVIFSHPFMRAHGKFKKFMNIKVVFHAVGPSLAE